jgi:hypothetical protein
MNLKLTEVTMTNRERLIVYPMLAVLTVAMLFDLRLSEAQKGPGDATFRRLTIVDSEGRPAIVIGVINEAAFLGFLDHNKNPRASFGLFNGDPGLKLLDPNGKTRIQLNFTEESFGLGMFTDKEREVAGISVVKGRPVLGFLEEGNPRVTMGLSEGGPAISLLHQNGDPGVVLGLTEKGSGLDISDRNRKMRANLAVVKGNPGMFLSDTNGRIRMGLILPPAGPRIHLDDQNGKQIWSAP